MISSGEIPLIRDTVADWLGKPFLGGLGIGDERVAIVLTLLIVILVAYLAITRPDIPDKKPVRGW